jgi:hypothetical protein
METDRVQQNLVNNSAPGGNNNVVHRTCSDVPASWEDIDLEDDMLLVDSSDCKTWCGVDVEDDWCCSPSSFSSLPAKMDYKKIDDGVWDFEPVDYGQIDAEAMYRLENSASAAYCSQVLEDFNCAETDEDVSEDDVSEDQFEELPHELIIKLGSVRKNLFPVLESLAEQSGERSRADVIPIEKKKWGPVVATSRMITRHHGGQNIIDKAKEYQKRKNLEVPPCFKGNSFPILHPDNLDDMSRSVKVMIGSDENSRSKIIHQLIDEELKKNLEFARNNPISVLPVSIDDFDNMCGDRDNMSIANPCTCVELNAQLTGITSHIKTSIRNEVVNDIYTTAVS